jgi:dihydroorotate dehydrogenase (fumarate)
MRIASVARSVAVGLAVVAASLLAWTVPASTAHADDAVGISIAPVDAQGKPDKRSRFTYEVDPGKTITDHVKVTNVGSSPLKITVYAADAYNDEKGDFALQAADEKAAGAAAWTTFDGKRQRQLQLAPGKSEVITFTVVVPADATPGDHAAGVIASAHTTGGQLVVERRIADRMYVRVSGDLQPILTVSSMSAGYSGGWNPLDGSVQVNATLSNTGNVALEGVVTITPTTWFGIPVGQLVRQDLGEVLPGNSVPVGFQASGVPAVGYVITHMLLQSGISGDAPDPGPLPVINRDAFTLAVPWLLVALIAIGVGVYFLLRWRRTVEAQRAAEWDAYQQAEAATRDATDGRDHLTTATTVDGGEQGAQ